MHRRNFLKSMLAGAAVLTVPQREAISARLDAMPPSEPAGSSAEAHLAAEVDAAASTFNWREPVPTVDALYADAEECDAVFVEADDDMYVYVDGAGWVQMTPPSPGPGLLPGTCPPGMPGWAYAVRFSAPVRRGRLLVRSTVPLYPKAVRLRGEGTLRQVCAGDGPPQFAAPASLEFFADRGGFPGSPRTVTVSTADAVDDSSDGPPVDWPSFDARHPLTFELEPARPDQTVHVVITVISKDPWPRVSFRYADEVAWCTATVVDYTHRKGEYE